MLTKISKSMIDGIIGGSKSIFNVTDYGALGDGTTDDTVAVNATIAAAVAAGGGKVYFPTGKYLLTSTITISTSNIYLCGDGMYLSVLYRTGNYGDTVLFTGNVGAGIEILNVGVEDLGFQSGGLTTSGAHIHWRGVTRVQCRGIFMLQGFEGMRCASLTAAHITDWYLVFTENFGGSKTNRTYLLCTEHDSFSHPSCGDVFFTNANLRGNLAQISTDYGIHITSADGLWFNNGHIASCGVANLVINHASAHSIGLVWFDTVMFDECQGSANVLIQGTNGSSTMGEIHFNTCSMKGVNVALRGVIISGDARCVTFDSCVIMQHREYGILINSSAVQQIRFNDCFVAGNSASGSGLFAGLQLEANVSQVYVSGGKFGGDSNYSGTGYQSYGIRIQSGSGSSIIISDVDLTGNVSGSIQNLASGSNIKIDNCIP